MVTRAHFGKANLYPGNKQTQYGDRISITTGFKGGLQGRAGYAVECAEQLPEKKQDYLRAVAIPYLQAVKIWLEIIRIGISGNDLYKVVEAVLPKEDYNWTLNPGRLCTDEEWMSSPIYPQSEETLQGGMLFQTNIIPGASDYEGVNYESGILLTDEQLRRAIAREYPAVWKRIVKRRACAQEVPGIRTQEDVLPTSMATACLRPHLLKKEMALVSV